MNTLILVLLFIIGFIAWLAGIIIPGFTPLTVFLIVVGSILLGCSGTFLLVGVLG
jgi:hypothetical protein